MPHQTLSNFLSIFIIVLISCNSSTCRASRLLPLEPEAPMSHNSEAPPPNHKWPFPKLKWTMTNFTKHEDSSTQPKTAKFPPWLQDPTKAEEPTPLEHQMPTLPKLQLSPMLKPQPKVHCFHELKAIPKPKWPMPKLPSYPAVLKCPNPELIPKAKKPTPAVPKRSIPKPTPKAQKPTPTKNQVPALPPLHEMPSLLSPELAPMPLVALPPPYSAEPKHH